MVQRVGLHQYAANWATAFAAALALAGLVFTAGSANQRLQGHDDALKAHDARISNAEGDVGELKVTLATLTAQMNDVQQTIHRLDGSPVPSPVTLYGSGVPANRRKLESASLRTNLASRP